MSERGLSELSNRGLLGNQVTDSMEFCKHCLLGKQKRVSFQAAMHRTKLKLDYIHSDLWDPFKGFFQKRL